ncbi:unnamed protein product [Rotaria sp. Silwood2]|nr:unnamed protein product [Rotaria sp. Silwood2]CAF3942048.1 unnamed protein product [Rotaria sp. Silwood2]
MSATTHFRVVFLILLVILYCNPSKGTREKLESQQFHPKCYSPCSTWPSFTNENNSYIYLLGLFLQQRSKTTLTKHFQTSAEPALFRAAILLAQQSNITINGKQIAYRVEETSGRDIIEALDRTCIAIAEDEVFGIVGPEYSTEAKTLARFGNRSGLPVVGYSTTEPELSDRNAYKTFYRLPPSDVIKARALLKLFQKYKWNSTNVIYQADSFGQGGLQALNEVFNDEVKIARSIRFNLFTDHIENLQFQLEDSPSRIVIVMAITNVTTKVIDLALKVGDVLAPSFLWILTASNSTMNILDNPKVNQLKGMLILRLVSPQTFNISTDTDALNKALNIWKQYDPDSFHANEGHLDIYALYAFDAAWLLILAFRELCQKNSTTCLSFKNRSNCFSSHLAARNELHQILQTMNFTGLTGLVQFGSNRTDRVDSTGAHYVIDNVQLSSANSNRLQLVEVLRLNGIGLSIIHNNNTAVWTTTGNRIQWPRSWNNVPTDYPLLKGRSKRKNFAS